MKRRLIFAVLSVLLALSLSVGGVGASFAAEPEIYSIRVGTTLAPSHPYNLGLEHFRDLVAEKTGGRIKVEVFHSSQLGNERDMVEGLQLGTLEMTLISTAPLSGFTSDFLVFDMPFIFSDVEVARACVDSDIGQNMLDGLSTQGIMGLCFFENGFRSITNSRKPILTPEDLNGIKIRTMENPIHMDSFRVMKADPTPMAFGELFTALQQKTIDGQENPLAIIDTSKFYEVQKYLSLTEHFYAPAPVLMSRLFYDSLSADLQAAIKECLLESRTYERQLLDEMNAHLISDLKTKGMEINTVDKEPFIKAVQPVYEQYTGTGPGKIPAELIRRVRDFKK
ncbi:MAG: TRAP transporter substrate-binding protein [Synergistaceae bacterium]|jgi:tripartite ATP-independent transporter DctP family solute receptor|nr:TRAP transporter substrate-binding protein [Synergistaceae bacterium]